MLIAVAGAWRCYESSSAKEFARMLLALAANADPRQLRSYQRKPKVAKKKNYVSKAGALAHVATAHVLAAGRLLK